MATSSRDAGATVRTKNAAEAHAATSPSASGNGFDEMCTSVPLTRRWPAELVELAFGREGQAGLAFGSGGLRESPPGRDRSDFVVWVGNLFFFVLVHRLEVVIGFDDFGGLIRASGSGRAFGGRR